MYLFSLSRPSPLPNILTVELFWNRQKPKENRASEHPLKYEAMIKGKNTGFYHMYCESNFVAKQYDNHNCSLAVLLAMMRFITAFNDHPVEKNWTIDNKEGFSWAEIPSSIFGSIGYSLVDKNHLYYVRNKVFTFIDALSQLVSSTYKTSKIENILRARLASEIVSEPQKNDQSVDLNRYDFVHSREAYDDDARIETQLCKAVMCKLDKIDHEFVNFANDGNDLYYALASILLSIDKGNIPKKAKTLQNT